MAPHEYDALIQDAERKALWFLRAFEAIQNEMRPEGLHAFQHHLGEVMQGGFRESASRLAQLAPPDGGQQFHDAFLAGIRHITNAGEAFLGADSRSYSLTAMDMRRSLCRGLQVLYGIRSQTPALAEYWVLPVVRQAHHDGAERQVALESPSSGNQAAVGVMHRRPSTSSGGAPLAGYSLYVPEGYTPERQWPLIVCLHGAYGRADHHVWSWLRPAKSRGYMLLAPKSLDVTWSILQPDIDIESVTGMLEEVCAAYSVDRSRVYLTGLSDGGTFTYLLGLSRPDLFAGIAPVAGDLHGMTDGMLRRKQGIELPIYIVHGAHDHIFPVATIRSGHELLTRLGYNSRYEELPDWGHSYCSFVNEQLVMPWFEELAGGISPPP